MLSSSSDEQYILAINCGSSSIKAKLFPLGPRTSGSGSSSAPDKPVAELSVKNIAAKREKVAFKISWSGEMKELGSDVQDEGEEGDKVEYKDLPPQLLKKLEQCSKIEKGQITYVTHRVVHGGPHKDPIVITREHTEGLKEMDTLSAFAPLHVGLLQNHSAVLAVRACLDALPKHTSVLLFDTLFHQTLPREVYTYALPEPDQPTPVPIRKYGFHGLSYMSILSSMAHKLGKPEKEVSIVVAHLGSGGSACCIRNGESVDTTMGLTPLEGLVGGTRSGSVDPTAVFHILKDCSADAGIDGMEVTKAEATLNKKSGLQALAGTSNFGTITQNMQDTSSSEQDRSALAYAVYVDRLMGFLNAYLAKLFSTLPNGIADVDGLVFSGGIGEKSDYLRADVVKRLGWLGAEIDVERNKQASKGEEEVAEISKDGSKLRAWTVQTDEEGVCYRLCREHMKI